MDSPSKPIPWRPVDSQCGGISAVVSTYVDYYLQKLIPFIPGVVKSSIDTIHLLNDIPSLKLANPNVWIITSDAKNMYSNIGIEEGLI